MATGIVLDKPTGYDVKTPDYDSLWKNLIETLFEEFMLFFAPDLHEKIDFTKPPDFLKQELYKEIIAEKKGTRVADEIAKVFLKNGEEKWILIHIEIQGDASEDFGERMFQYFYRIYDRFDREVYALALITDNAAEQTNRFHYSFYGTKVDYTYNVYRFQDQRITNLEQSNNPFAHAVIAGIYASRTKNDSDARYTFKRKLMIQILQKFSTKQDDTRAYLSALFYFIDYLLQVPRNLTLQLKDAITPYMGKEVVQRMQTEKTNPSQTLEEIFAELREEGKEEGKEEGIEKGIEKGRKDALKHVVQTLIHEGHSDEQIIKITKLDPEEVKELRRSFNS